jgi:hypothetical protein
MKELSRNFGGTGQGVGAAVNRIARDGATGGGGMNANLVGATRMKLEFQQASARPAGNDFPVCFCGTASSADGHTLPDDGVTADGSLPSAGIATGTPEDKGEVGFFRFAFAELATEFAVSSIIFGGNQKSGCFAVEAVNDAGPIGTASRGQIAFAVVKKGSGEGSGGASGARVNMHARGFVDDQKISVFVKNLKRDGFWGDISCRGGRDTD